MQWFFSHSQDFEQTVLPPPRVPKSKFAFLTSYLTYFRILLPDVFLFPFKTRDLFVLKFWRFFSGTLWRSDWHPPPTRRIAKKKKKKLPDSQTAFLIRFIKFMPWICIQIQIQLLKKKCFGSLNSLKSAKFSEKKFNFFVRYVQLH